MNPFPSLECAKYERGSWSLVILSLSFPSLDVNNVQQEDHGNFVSHVRLQHGPTYIDCSYYTSQLAMYIYICGSISHGPDSVLKTFS